MNFSNLRERAERLNELHDKKISPLNMQMNGMVYSGASLSLAAIQHIKGGTENAVNTLKNGVIASIKHFVLTDAERDALKDGNSPGSVAFIPMSSFEQKAEEARFGMSM